MKINMIGNIVTWMISIYFILSGLLAAADVDAKLERIGLTALNDDGKIAFLLIYTSLMVGIGLAMLLILHVSNTWHFSLMLGGTIISSFVVFRIVGAITVGRLSDTQIAFIATELVELGIILLIFFKAGGFLKQPCLTSRLWTPPALQGRTECF